MKRAFYVLTALLLAAALVTACGGASSGGASSGGTGSEQTGGTATTGGTTSGGAASGGAGDPKAGETLFAAATIGANPGCKTCHSLDGSKLVGPTMQGIATRAATEADGESVDQYLRSSITDPNAVVVEGFAPGVMPSFKTVLSDTQLNDLVAYLQTLK